MHPLRIPRARYRLASPVHFPHLRTAVLPEARPSTLSGKRRTLTTSVRHMAKLCHNNVTALVSTLPMSNNPAVSRPQAHATQRQDALVWIDCEVLFTPLRSHTGIAFLIPRPR